MRIGTFNYVKPQSLQEACALLADSRAGATVLAGEITEKTLQEIRRAASGAAKPVHNIFGATVSYRREMADKILKALKEKILSARC